MEGEANQTGFAEAGSCRCLVPGAFGIYYFVIPVYSWVSGSVGGGKDSDNFHRETGTEYGYNSIYADIAG